MTDPVQTFQIRSRKDHSEIYTLRTIEDYNRIYRDRDFEIISGPHSEAVLAAKTRQGGKRRYTIPQVETDGTSTADSNTTNESSVVVSAETNAENTQL